MFFQIPEELNPGTDEREIQENGEKLPVEVRNLIDELRLNEAIEAIMAYVRSINRYMEQKAPWKLVKSDLEMAGTVLYTAAQGFCIAAKLLAPVMPTKINEILSAFPIDGKNESWGSLTNGEKLGKFPILFPRIQPATDKPVQEKKMKIEEEENLNLISIDEFFKAKLVTAKVLEAEKVQGTSKLLKLQIDTGLDTRQIVAGIAEHYTPEQLIGKTIVVVVNLQPATIRGIESNGMLLAAKKGKQLQLITTFDDIEPGAPVG